MSYIKLTGPWKATIAGLVVARSRLKTAARQALLQEAHYFRRAVVTGIREQAPGGQRFKPLAPSTIAGRKRQGYSGTKALIRTGDLRNAIAVTQQGESVFVGILRTVKGHGSLMMVNIAAVHEFGTSDGRIPARPFLQPTFDALYGDQQAVRDRYFGRIGRLMGGFFGRIGSG